MKIDEEASLRWRDWTQAIERPRHEAEELDRRTIRMWGLLAAMSDEAISRQYGNRLANVVQSAELQGLQHAGWPSFLESLMGPLSGTGSGSCLKLDVDEGGLGDGRYLD